MTEAAELIEQIKNSNDTYRRNQCRHTLPEGERCGSPALRGEKFCYYHHETRKPVTDAHHRQARRNSFELPKPTSRAAIQDALGEIITRISYNDIDPRRAGLLLYALQIASTNIKDHQAQQEATQHQTAKQQVANPTAQPATHTVIPTEAAQDTAPEANLTFEAEIFPPPLPQLRPIRRQTFAALLDSLARHHRNRAPARLARRPKTRSGPCLAGLTFRPSRPERSAATESRVWSKARPEAEKSPPQSKSPK